MRRAAFFSSGGFWYPVSDRLRRLVRSRTFPAGFRGAAATLSQPVACCCEPRRRAARCETRLPKRPDCAAWPFRKSDSISDDGRTFRIRFDSAAVSDRRFCLGAVWRCPLAFCYFPPPGRNSAEEKVLPATTQPFPPTANGEIAEQNDFIAIYFPMEICFYGKLSYLCCEKRVERDFSWNGCQCLHSLCSDNRRRLPAKEDVSVNRKK